MFLYCWCGLLSEDMFVSGTDTFNSSDFAFVHLINCLTADFLTLLVVLDFVLPTSDNRFFLSTVCQFKIPFYSFQFHFWWHLFFLNILCFDLFLFIFLLLLLLHKICQLIFFGTFSQISHLFLLFCLN